MTRTKILIATADVSELTPSELEALEGTIHEVYARFAIRAEQRVRPAGPRSERVGISTHTVIPVGDPEMDPRELLSDASREYSAAVNCGADFNGDELDQVCATAWDFVARDGLPG